MVAIELVITDLGAMLAEALCNLKSYTVSHCIALLFQLLTSVYY